MALLPADKVADDLAHGGEVRGARRSLPELFALLATDAALAVLYAAVGLGLTLLAARRIRAGARASLL